MKKFSVKSLLVLVLVLVLALSIVLVACNKKNNDPAPEPTPDQPVNPDPAPTDASVDKETYFTNMWEIANDIGGEAISTTDNVALSLDLSVALNQLKAGKVEQETLNVGIKLDVVLDRTKTAATNSAVRALLYNGKDGATWCAVYYFLSEPNYLYIDLAAVETVESLSEMEMLKDRYLKVAFDTDGKDNASYAGSVAEFINNHKFMEDASKADSGFTIADVVDALVKDTGAEWNLNKLLKNIAGVFNLDLASILKTVSGFLPGAYDEATGEIHIENALSSSIVQSLLGDVTTTEAGGRKEYSVDLKVSTLLNLAKDALKNLPSIVQTVLNKDTEINVSYGEKAGKIDGFALTLGLKSLMDEKTNLYPQIKVAINNLELRKVANTAAAAKAKVEFSDSAFKDAKVIDINTLCNGLATIQVEVFKEGTPKTYLVTAYSDVDIIDTIIKIVKIAKDQDNTSRAERLKAIHFEIGMKAEELDAAGKATGNVPFQILLSAPKGEASIVIGEKSYVADLYDIVKNLDTLMSGGGSDDSADPEADGEESTDILQGIMDALKLVAETVKVNGEELSMDALKGIFFDADGLKENWHEFTLDANFTKEVCDQLCEMFGAENANEVSVNIQKTAKGCTARAEYLNNAGKDAAGKDVMDNYFVEITSSWDFDQNKFAIELKFDMWDKNANDGVGAKVTYDCKYDGSLTFENVEDGKLLKSGQATLSLTRQYADATAAESVFVATLGGEVNYNAAKDSITNASLRLIVKKDSTPGTAPYFEINGTLTVSGEGKVLVKFTDHGCEYTATSGVKVETTWTESLLEWIGQLDASEGKQVKELVIPTSVANILKAVGLAQEADFDEGTGESKLTVGALLGRVSIYLDKENVITTSYEKSLDATTKIETEKFAIGLNEEALGHNFRFVFEFRRNAETEQPTYAMCGYDTGDGTNGLGVKLDTFTCEFGKEIPATSKAAAAPRTGDNAKVLNSENFAETISSLMMYILPLFM